VDNGGSTLVLAVADGAGSARCGGQGAGMAAPTAVRIARSLLDEGLPSDDEAAARLVHDVLRGTLDDLLTLVDLWHQNGGAPVENPMPQDLHTTLLLAVLAGGRLAVGNIGDGWLITRQGGGLGVVAAPAPGEYSNETFFITSDGALDDALIEVVSAEDLDAIALLTDGMAWCAVDLACRTPSMSLFRKLFTFAGDPALSADDRELDLAGFLASEAVVRRSDDDKTLVLAVNQEGA
jgi:hypothetical protein